MRTGGVGQTNILMLLYGILKFHQLFRRVRRARKSMSGTWCRPPNTRPEIGKPDFGAEGGDRTHVSTLRK